MNNYPAWQPIATAPQDGTWILAVVNGRHPHSGKGWAPAVVQWFDDEWHFNEEDDAFYEPTHWMPLPPNPCEVQ